MHSQRTSVGFEGSRCMVGKGRGWRRSAGRRVYVGEVRPVPPPVSSEEGRMEWRAGVLRIVIAFFVVICAKSSSTYFDRFWARAPVWLIVKIRRGDEREGTHGYAPEAGVAACAEAEYLCTWELTEPVVDESVDGHRPQPRPDVYQRRARLRCDLWTKVAGKGVFKVASVDS